MTCTLPNSANIHPVKDGTLAARKVYILIACEESQTECIAFRKAGAIAFSCDLQPCSGSHPEWHFMGDALKHLVPGRYITESGLSVDIPHWDLLIAHPPCTYLSRAAASYLYPGGQLDEHRYNLGLAARSFFMKFLHAQVPFICVENPTPFKVFNLPPPSFFVNPSDFGSPWLKKTLYWTTPNLPPLMLGCSFPRPRSFVYSTKGSKKRSKSFPEIAEAMAAQWLPIILDSFTL